MVSSVSLIAELGWIAFLHSRLLQAQYYRHPRSAIDIVLVVIIFWPLFVIIDQTFRLLLDLVCAVILKHRHIFSEEGVTGPRQRLVAYDHGSLLRQLLLTLVIYCVLNFWLETILPLWGDIYDDPESVLYRFHLRTQELFELCKAIVGIKQRPPMTSRRVGDRMDEACGPCDLIALEREALVDRTGGERTLNWNITIDRGALDELKEILGPPGGFGEMGFCVSNGGVCIGATAIGASFSLNFGLGMEVEDQQPGKMAEGKE